MNQEKFLFIDRDGTLIEEPQDDQVDSIEKLNFKPFVMEVLQSFVQSGFKLVMVTNQDGLGTPSFPAENFFLPHELMLKIFASQGIIFDCIRICPHVVKDNCECRKPKVGLLLDYLQSQCIDRHHSYVIGDRETDLQLAKNIGISGIRLEQDDTRAWLKIRNQILLRSRTASVTRKTNETAIKVAINLDQTGLIEVNTRLGFFDHMLMQLAKHGGFSLQLSVQGDLEIDDHHTVEDTAIVLGDALRQALGDKRGIERYGYLLPMDETLAQVALDLSGRPFFNFEGVFHRERIGDLSTELVAHFFRSFADSLNATLHISVRGENTHHMIEGIFKAVGKSIHQAIKQNGLLHIPSTKGVL